MPCGCSSVGSGRSTTILSMVVRTSFMSFRLAPATAKPIGTPWPSVSRLRLTPSLPRSVGLGPVFFPAQRGFGHGPVHAQPVPVDPFQLIELHETRLQFQKHVGTDSWNRSCAVEPGTARSDPRPSTGSRCAARRRWRQRTPDQASAAVHRQAMFVHMYRQGGCNTPTRHPDAKPVVVLLFGVRARVRLVVCSSFMLYTSYSDRHLATRPCKDITVTDSSLPASARFHHARVAKTWPGITELDINDLELLLERIA